MTNTLYANANVGLFTKNGNSPNHRTANLCLNITNPSTCFPMRVVVIRTASLCVGNFAAGYNGAYIELLSSSDGASYNSISLSHPFRTGPFLDSPHFFLTALNGNGSIAAGDSFQRCISLNVRDNPQNIDISAAYAIELTGIVMQEC